MSIEQEFGKIALLWRKFNVYVLSTHTFKLRLSLLVLEILDTGQHAFLIETHLEDMQT